MLQRAQTRRRAVRQSGRHDARTPERLWKPEPNGARTQTFMSSTAQRNRRDRINPVCWRYCLHSRLRVATSAQRIARGSPLQKRTPSVIPRAPHWCRRR